MSQPDATKKGGQGEVFFAKRRGSQPGSAKYAVKMPLSVAGDLKKEADFLQKLGGCAFITKFVAFYENELYGNQRRQFVVMEHMDGGDLMEGLLLVRRELCVQRGAGSVWMSEDEIRTVMWRVLKALEFLHVEKKMLNRDLKPENVLFVAKGADGCGDPRTAKLADFGHTRELENLSRAMTWVGLGTPAYTAPELAQAQSGMMNPGHAYPADMWSVGASLFVCMAQYWPCVTRALHCSAVALAPSTLP